MVDSVSISNCNVLYNIDVHSQYDVTDLQNFYELVFCFIFYAKQLNFRFHLPQAILSILVPNALLYFGKAIVC